MDLKRKPSVGFKAQPSVYKLSVAPTGRARCRICKRQVSKGELRLETCAFVMPGRRTVFVSHIACMTVAQAKGVWGVYGCVDWVPVGAGVEPERLSRAQARISSLSGRG